MSTILPSWVEVTCAHCGHAFMRRRSHYLRNEQRGTPHYCNQSCRSQALSPRQPRLAWTEVECHQCSVRFAKRDCEIRKNRSGRHYCSVSCHLANEGESKSYRKRDGRHEHRIVAEQILGRALKPGEVVHHIDENHRNNSPSNLQVLPSQAEHARLHAAQRARSNA
jgi:hypothetical protein